MTKLYEVHLCQPNVVGDFVVPVRADREIDALAQALAAFPMCYVSFTKEVKGAIGPEEVCNG
jgi:hypothetical protein